MKPKFFAPAAHSESLRRGAGSPASQSKPSTIFPEYTSNCHTLWEPHPHACQGITCTAGAVGVRACILSRVCAGITQVPLVPAVPCNTALSADLRFPPPLPPRHLFYFIFVGAGRGSTTHARLTRGRAAACAGAGGWLVSWSDGWPVGAGWMAWVRAHEYVCMRPGALCAPPNTVRAVWEDGAVELSGRLLRARRA